MNEVDDELILKWRDNGNCDGTESNLLNKVEEI